MKKFIYVITIIIAIVAIVLSVYVLLNNRKIIINFNTNSENKIDNIEILKGNRINLPILEREGYEFLGWYIDDNKIDSNYKFDKTTILSAKWEKNNKEIVDNEKTYVVKFIEVFGSRGRAESIPSQTIKEGEKVKKPELPPRDKCYIFDNWYLDNHIFDFNTIITSDITLEARYYDYGWCEGQSAKPIIYLYPEKEIEVDVKLGNINNVTTIYPKYNDGWKVIAKPDGTLIDKNTGRSLYSLYWEGKNYPGSQTNEGFVVKGEDTASFLEEKLEILGLNEREAEEFIIYWLPQMEHNKYNYIKFADRSVIDNYMPLEITPKPDTLIRVMMEFMPLDEKINVKEQKLEKVERKGYTAVEWGGSNLKNNNKIR